MAVWDKIFQPTLPARGATTKTVLISLDCEFQPTLPARGATQLPQLYQSVPLISTHAPRTGSDASVSAGSCRQSTFQPTLPARGATVPVVVGSVTMPNFNPRSPHGERRHRLNQQQHRRKFQPTLPARGATAYEWQCFDFVQFQPTLPARGATLHDRVDCAGEADFNPRSPHGERQRFAVFKERQNEISTHAPRTGSDTITLLTNSGNIISTHAPRTGSDKA